MPVLVSNKVMNLSYSVEHFLLVLLHFLFPESFATLPLREPLHL